MESLTPSSHPGLVGDQPVAPECPGVEASVKRRRREGGFPVGWLIAPSALWLLVFLVIPLVSIVVFSLWTSTGYGLEADLNFGNYAVYFLAEGFFDPDHRNFLRLSVFIRTLGSTFAYTLEVMVLCLLLGYPIAYFLAMRVSSFKWQMALFLSRMYTPIGLAAGTTAFTAFTDISGYSTEIQTAINAIAAWSLPWCCIARAMPRAAEIEVPA